MEKKRKIGVFAIISPFLVYYAVSLVVEIIASVIIMVPEMQKGGMISVEETANYVMNIFMSHLTLITSAVALFVIPFFWLMYRKDVNYEKALGVAEREKAPIWKYVIIIGLAITACIGLNNLLVLGNVAAYSGTYEETTAALYKESFVIQVIGLGLVVPVAEEFMFRGIIYKRLSFITGRGKAMMLSALMFGLYHGNLVQAIYGFVLGYLAVYIYEKYGSLKASILFHATINLTSVIGTELGLYTWIFGNVLRVGIVTVVCGAVASSFFVFMQKQFKAEEKKDA
ncbi:lysostaphin resistance A-like protein [Faecalimonas sp.]